MLAKGTVLFKGGKKKLLYIGGREVKFNTEPKPIFEIIDSGERLEYPTGAVRDTNNGKIRWDLIPVEALKRVALHYTNGAKKYGDNNWKKGIPTERFIESAMRHFMQYRLGEKDEDHLSAVVFNILGIIYNEEKSSGEVG